MSRRLPNAEVPRGAVLVLCALLLALPGGLAIGHELRYDSEDRWVHHHTTDYTTCNEIDQDTDLKAKATQARQAWHDLHTETGVRVPPTPDCHPSGGAEERSHIELKDGHWGDTGWQASVYDTSINNAPAGYHARHTHALFNLANFGPGVTNYVKRTLACRAIGQTMGLAPAPDNEGPANDCLSYGGNVGCSNCYSNQPGPHSVEQLEQAYWNHAVELTVAGPLVDAIGTLTDDQYELWIDAYSVNGMQSIEVLVDGQREALVTEPCPTDEEACAEDTVFDFLPAEHEEGGHVIKVVATDSGGASGNEEIVVDVGSVSTEDEVYDETPPPEDGEGPGCTPFGIRPKEEGVLAVAHGTWTGGTETTQYSEDDAYQVARCNHEAELIKLQEVAVIDVEGQAIPIVEGELSPVSSTGDADFQAWFADYPDPEGSTPSFWSDLAASAIPPTPTTIDIQADPDSLGHLTDRGCARRRFRLFWRWDFNPRYKIHGPSLPHGAKSARRIRNGHVAWNKTSDNCGIPDRSDFRMVYDGRTGNRAQPRDGRDTVDFGFMRGAFCGHVSFAVGCAVGRGRLYQDAELMIPVNSEVDIRFSIDPRFSDGSKARWYSGLKHRVPSGRYDLFSIAAHEAGHKLGLHHVRRTFHQVLSPRLGTDTRRRTLGRGDVRGMNRLYRSRQLGPDPR